MGRIRTSPPASSRRRQPRPVGTEGEGGGAVRGRGGAPARGGARAPGMPRGASLPAVGGAGVGDGRKRAEPPSRSAACTSGGLEPGSRVFR